MIEHRKIMKLTDKEKEWLHFQHGDDRYITPEEEELIRSQRNLWIPYYVIQCHDGFQWSDVIGTIYLRIAKELVWFLHERREGWQQYKMITRKTMNINKANEAMGMIKLRVPLKDKATWMQMAKDSNMKLGEWIEFVLDTVIETHRKNGGKSK